jgi:hypothetical protein
MLHLGVECPALGRSGQQSRRSYGKSGRISGIGCWGFGSMIAITISWSVNHSILWMILHGILSWFYIIYYAIKH